jgi:hypothetical protein
MGLMEIMLIEMDAMNICRIERLSENEIVRRCRGSEME